MGTKQISSEEILTWRRVNLSKGGRKVDIDWLLDVGGGLSSSELYKIILYPERSFLLEKSLQELEDIWKFHLTTNKPLQHIIGKCPWRDFVLEVNSDALIPRQESELLIELALKRFKNKSKGVWADLGTGSGAIAIGLARSFPEWNGHAVDCSKKAISLAIKNINSFSLKKKVSIHLGSWFEPLQKLNNSIDLVVANPPYIPRSLITKLHPTVRDYEPFLALCGGDDGMDACRKVVSGAFEVLSSGGYLIFEHHHDQSDRALGLLVDYGYKNVSYENDLQGIRRFAIGSHP